jgi:hypothetical protein
MEFVDGPEDQVHHAREETARTVLRVQSSSSDQSERNNTPKRRVAVILVVCALAGTLEIGGQPVTCDSETLKFQKFTPEAEKPLARIIHEVRSRSAPAFVYFGAASKDAGVKVYQHTPNPEDTVPTARSLRLRRFLSHSENDWLCS